MGFNLNKLQNENVTKYQNVIKMAIHLSKHFCFFIFFTPKHSAVFEIRAVRWQNERKLKQTHNIII